MTPSHRRLCTLTILLLGAAHLISPRLVPPLHAQNATTDASDTRRIATVDFEDPPVEDQEAGWRGYPVGTFLRDSTSMRSGRYSARMVRSPGSPGEFTNVGRTIPVDFRGRSVELQGWLRLEEVSGSAGLWLRVDGSDGPLRFDNMMDRRLQGTVGWTRYSVTLPLDPAARQIAFGALVVGTGTVDVDDLELILHESGTAPAAARDPLSTSGIELPDVSRVQIENLVLLGKVWGFAKYHHPRVAAGELDWDRELMEILPAVLDAPDRASAVGVLAAWLADYGEIGPCDPCAEPPVDAHLQPDIAWIGNGQLLGARLSELLQQIHRNRPSSGEHHYVARAPGAGNALFSAEHMYAETPYPDDGLRLLALYRFWNVVEYWFPYRDVIGEEWDGVLREFIPRIASSPNRDSYVQELMRLSARVNDTHANLWQNAALRPPRGSYQLPVRLSFIEDEPVVTGYLHGELGPATGLGPGDVILALDGMPVESLVRSVAPYYGASNEAARLRYIAQSLTRGLSGPVTVTVRRNGLEFEISPDRAALEELNLSRELTHDLRGPALQKLSEEVAYLKMSAFRADSAAAYVRAAVDADVWVIDIRNYPSEFGVFALGQHLVSEPTPFARFTRGDWTNPGAFLWGDTVSLAPAEPHYPGTVVILVDEISLSQAEYTAMAFRAGTRALVAGSTTAGADGNVSPIPLPGGITGMISGLGVFYPDRTPTQRVGIVPDLEIRPSIEGVRDGRDEVLEAAVSHVLEREFRLPPD